MSEKRFDIRVSAAEIAEEIVEAARQSIKEEDLRLRTEIILRMKILDKLGIPYARYEYTLVSGGRTDALYGYVILEYEKPGTFRTKTGFEKAIEHACMHELAKVEHEVNELAAKIYGLTDKEFREIKKSIEA